MKLRSTYGILIILILMVFGISTQAIDHGWGLKLGMTINVPDHNLNRELQSSVGFDLGVCKEIPLAWGFKFIPELHFVSKGIWENDYYYYSYSSNYYNDYYESWNNYLFYFTVPLLLAYEIPLKEISFYFFFGPRIDFLLGYNSQTLGKYFSEHPEVKLGFDLGYGNKLSFFTDFSILWEVRVNLDLDYFYKEPREEVYWYYPYDKETDEYIRNMGFMMLFGVVF